MRLTFLGTGTSTGVPQIGCKCNVCTSADPRDKRLRTSVLIEDEDTCVLLDCGPDFREQMLRLPRFKPLDSVFITHEHYDHVGGLDDLRPFCVFGEVHVYSDSYCCNHLRERIPYCFAEHKYPGVPQIHLTEIKPHQTLKIKHLAVIPFRVMHGKLPILGFRLNDLVYITDMKTIEPSEMDYVRGCKTLVVNGLRHTPHPSHQTIEEAIAFSESLASPDTYLIHMGHHAGLHAESDQILPPHIRFAYDGLTIDC